MSTLTSPTVIAEPVPKRKRGISLLTVTEKERAFSGREMAIAGLLVLEAESCESCRIVR